MEHEALIRILGLIGSNGDAETLELLERYGNWLATEAISAGGLGPGETGRIEDRHLVDSLLFATEIDQSDQSVLDLGSGVGLPGIPLAIAFPNREFVLLDRSGRRVDLAKRAVRILGLDNVVVEQRDFHKSLPAFSTVVSRAAVDLVRDTKLVNSLVAPGGLAVFGGSWVARPEIAGWESREVGLDILDREVWLLIMRRHE